MKKQLVHGSTFSGIGSPEIAAEMLGWENAFHCEINPFGRKVLDYWFPNAKSYENIKTTNFSEWRGKIDVLTGGFPCQPFSYAGKRRGTEDDRYLWDYMLKCIQEIRPTWFVGENVGGITTMVFPGSDVKVGGGGTLFTERNLYRRDERYVIEEICSNLEREGYSVQPMLIPACAVNAPHRRDRIFFIAHRDALADTDRSDNGCGVSGEDEGKSREKQLQERNEIRKPIQPTGVRSEMQGSSANTDGSGHPTQAEGSRTEGSRCQGYVQQGKRKRETEWVDGLSQLQGNVADTDCRRSGQVSTAIHGGFADGDLSLCDGSEWDAPHSVSERLERRDNTGSPQGERMPIWGDAAGCSGEDMQRVFTSGCLLPETRWRDFPTQSPIYRGNDGIPFDVDCLSIPFSKWKNESLKAYGNSIVVQVMYEIFRAIDIIENEQ